MSPTFSDQALILSFSTPTASTFTVCLSPGMSSLIHKTALEPVGLPPWIQDRRSGLSMSNFCRPPCPRFTSTFTFLSVPLPRFLMLIVKSFEPEGSFLLKSPIGMSGPLRSVTPFGTSTGLRLTFNTSFLSRGNTDRFCPTTRILVAGFLPQKCSQNLGQMCCSRKLSAAIHTAVMATAIPIFSVHVQAIGLC